MSEFNFDLVGFNKKALTIREGKALELHNPVKNTFQGIINSPRFYIEKRVEEFNHLSAVITVNREKLKISLRIDEKNVFGDEIIGQLSLSEKFNVFGINSKNYITPHEMSDLFKMNRTAFENQDEAMKLVAVLQNFKAKVDSELEKKNDNRGNTTDYKSQVVTSNLPSSFKLKIPIFKGQESSLIEVEVYIRPSDLCCTLISPEANDIIELTRNAIIDAEIAGIGELSEDILIIEQ